MQRGPSLHPVSRMSGVWSLRILISSCLGFWWFIVSVMRAISIRPSEVVCRPDATTSMHAAKRSKSDCFEVRSGCSRKNGMIVSVSSLRFDTTYWHRCSLWLSCRRLTTSRPTPEELLELLEAAHALRALCHDKPVAHLITGCVAASARAVKLPHETDREASFSVYKADHPTTELDQPFLLIVRTRHVVTIVNVRSDDTPVARDTRSFQHMARCTHPCCQGGGQRTTLGRL